jgi:hypothetical protein
MEFPREIFCFSLVHLEHLEYLEKEKSGIFMFFLGVFGVSILANGHCETCSQNEALITVLRNFFRKCGAAVSFMRLPQLTTIYTVLNY